MSEYALWDQILLGLTLLYVVRYLYVRIKSAFNPGKGGCGCGNAGACNSKLKTKVGNEQLISVDALRKTIRKAS